MPGLIQQPFTRIFNNIQEFYICASEVFRYCNCTAGYKYAFLLSFSIAEGLRVSPKTPEAAVIDCFGQAGIDRALSRQGSVLLLKLFKRGICPLRCHIPN